ncbi:MAG: hypothetical protein PHY92_04380 [Alphaproteobacteria bacterium]|nr:hypothetical protein [Alphaproteobacteria bacterium]
MTKHTLVLAGIPAGLRTPLLHCYQEIVANYLEHRWEPSELNGGKFCEIVYTVIKGFLEGKFSAEPSKPKNMRDACRSLEEIPANLQRLGDRSLRILIPRMLPALYEIRNNRGVGHVGGDVNPNYLDATAVYGIASWMLAELIRIFHSVSTKEAQETVDALIERKLPLIWEIEGVKRVLDPSIGNSDQVLLLANRMTSWVSVRNLFDWVEYSSLSMFRKRIIVPLHEKRLIEFDRNEDRIKISPTGVREVEHRILKSRS